MARLRLFAEGATEQTFADNVLINARHDKAISLMILSLRLITSRCRNSGL